MTQPLLSMITSPSDFELKISSKPENICLIEPYLEKVRAEHDINEDLYFNMLLVLTEAVNNSIFHGNARNPRKNVNISMQKSQHKLCFFITDEGSGFDPRKLPDPTAPMQIEQPNGRGVFLMRQLSDYVYYYDNGRKVEIQFTLK